jgi:hypothetical protein
MTEDLPKPDDAEVVAPPDTKEDDEAENTAPLIDADVDEHVPPDTDDQESVEVHRG